MFNLFGKRYIQNVEMKEKKILFQNKLLFTVIHNTLYGFQDKPCGKTQNEY